MPSALSDKALSSDFMMKRVEMPCIPSDFASSRSSLISTRFVRPFSMISSPSYSFSLVIRSHFGVGSSRERMANIAAISRVWGAMWLRKPDLRRIFS